VVSATEVAVMVMLRLAETVDGALYVAVVVVALLKAPHSVPVTPVPDALHVTPLELVSFNTMAVKFTVCPWSMLTCVAGEMETEIMGGAEGGGAPPPPPPPPPLPHAQVTTTLHTASMSFFIAASTPLEFLHDWLSAGAGNRMRKSGNEPTVRGSGARRWISSRSISKR